MRVTRIVAGTEISREVTKELSTPPGAKPDGTPPPRVLEVPPVNSSL